MIRFARKKAGTGWRKIVLIAAIALLGSGPLRAEDRAPFHALLIGGGPDQASNAAEIEAHLRFVAQLLPPSATRVTLFADGKAGNATVAYTDSTGASAARRALEILLPAGNFGPSTQARAPHLGVPIDGASRLEAIRRAMAKVAGRVRREPAPVLLYVAGHGSRGADSQAKASYDLWDGGELTVTDLAVELARLPAHTPVVLVMAQCFSGAFADVIFRKGDAEGEFAGHDLAGFFSAAEDREAAGCGTEINTADYQDFSSHFFGALSGRNLLGQPVRDADADGDGRVSLHEAFCYALIHDDSIDTPTSTSQAFLKRFVPMKDAEIYGTPYRVAGAAATPAEHAVLDALSAELELSGEERFLAAYDRLCYSDPTARASVVKEREDARARLHAMSQAQRNSLFARAPALRWNDVSPDAAAADEATQVLVKDPEICRQLLAAKAACDHAEDAVDKEEALLLRFTGLCESVLRRKRLGEGTDAKLRAQFAKLWAAENRSLPLRTSD